MIHRRHFLKQIAFVSLSNQVSAKGGLAAEDKPPTPWFQTRGIVMRTSDLASLDWPERASRAGLTTIATHITPKEVSAFMATDAGQAFIEKCRKLKVEVEHELHATSDLLPRDLFAKDASMFRMNEEGSRVGDWNLCVHSKNAIEIVCENAIKYARILRPTTGRYFYWMDDTRPMCRCPACQELSDSDQALLLENALLQALRKHDPRATLAHLCYKNTLTPPRKIRPLPGIFLEYAPIGRQHDQPMSRREIGTGGDNHGRLLDLLDANLEVFPRATAQVLEYWLNALLFARFSRKKITKLKWLPEVFAADVAGYAERGIRHIACFSTGLDAAYIRNFGEFPLNEYGQELNRWRGLPCRTTAESVMPSRSEL